MIFLRAIMTHVMFLGNLYWNDEAKMNTCLSSFGKEYKYSTILCLVYSCKPFQIVDPKTSQVCCVVMGYPPPLMYQMYHVLLSSSLHPSTRSQSREDEQAELGTLMEDPQAEKNSCYLVFCTYHYGGVPWHSRSTGGYHMLLIWVDMFISDADWLLLT